MIQAFLQRHQLNTKSGNSKKCPVKTGFAVHPKPDWVSSVLRIMQLFGLPLNATTFNSSPPILIFLDIRHNRFPGGN